MTDESNITTQTIVKQIHKKIADTITSAVINIKKETPPSNAASVVLSLLPVQLVTLCERERRGGHFLFVLRIPCGLSCLSPLALGSQSVTCCVCIQTVGCQGADEMNHTSKAAILRGGNVLLGAIHTLKIWHQLLQIAISCKAGKNLDFIHLFSP